MTIDKESEVALRWLGEEIDRLRAINAELVGSLEAVLQLMTDGILVRDTRNDHDPAWAIKQMPLVMALKRADEVIRKAKP